jgi:hypothetical protein
MVRRSAALIALYLAGIAIVGGWALWHVLGGTVTRENAAGVIVFPLAWTFGFWPTVMPVLLAARVWRLQSMLEAYVARRAAGLSTEAPERELEDTVTLLVAHENGIPERLARLLVRRFLTRLAPPGAHARGDE